VNAEDGGSGALVEVVDARTVDVDEAPERRKRLLDLPCRACIGDGERRDRHGEKCEGNDDDPRQDDHVRVSSAALSTIASG
jgi:hypothetical protein